MELALDEQISMGSMLKFNEIILAIEKMQSIPVRIVSPMVRRTVRLPKTLSLPVRAKCVSMVRQMVRRYGQRVPKAKFADGSRDRSPA